MTHFETLLQTSKDREVLRQFRYHSWNQIHDQVDGQPWRQVSHQVWVQVDKQVWGKPHIQIWEELNDPL
jgi:hypothetical protein